MCTAAQYGNIYNLIYIAPWIRANTCLNRGSYFVAVSVQGTQGKLPGAKFGAARRNVPQGLLSAHRVDAPLTCSVPSTISSHPLPARAPGFSNI
jgi:hypothetical protein